jgi:DNA-binding CsgD family transcriptional regulator
VVVSDDATAVADSPLLTPVVETAEKIVCRVSPEADGPPSDHCEQEPCLAAGLSCLPVVPYNRTFDSEAVEFCVAATESEVRDCLTRLESAGFQVHLEQLSLSPRDDPPELVVVDRGVLTPRQREVARLAVARGYPRPDPPPASELADELDIEKSTFSEHLRAVRRKIGVQLFLQERSC